MNNENEKKGVQLNDNELDGVAGGATNIVWNGQPYHCEYQISNFDSLFSMGPPHGACSNFEIKDSSNKHCCAHCKHCIKDPTSGTPGATPKANFFIE